MNWWGKLLGGGLGFMMGGPLGAIMGAAFGHQFDRGMQHLGQDIPTGDTQRTQAAFFTASFSVMGYIAKIDGQVSKSEIRLAEQVMNQMQLTPDQRKAAINLFNEGKQAHFPLDDVLAQFRKECHRRTSLLQMFMEILISTALADGHIDSAEQSVIIHIGEQLGFNASVIQHLMQMVGAQQHYVNQPARERATLKDAYAVMGVSRDVSDSDLKKAYRRLMSQHHPDKLVAKGLPEEMIKLATEKTQDIKAAYEQIKQARTNH
ncbi:MAG: co-chaperone DjlA [Gammaproteobacteria bacterium]|nr:co-chaperone DjlA [Gammaproteobacteria bacterium]